MYILMQNWHFGKYADIEVLQSELHFVRFNIDITSFWTLTSGIQLDSHYLESA